jgi:large subunit ribosomal protein L24
MKVKKGDEVIVIAGKDRGQKGRVLASFPTENKVIVEGVNRVTKHTRVSANARGSKTGGIITQEAKIDVSNVMVVDADGKAARVGYRRDDETGRNVRVSRRTGKDIS